MKKFLLFVLMLLPWMVSAQTKRTIHVATAGTLSNYISDEEKYQIEELTLTGELNGTDFNLIREMAGTIEKEVFRVEGSYKSEYLRTDGKLKSLNIAESKIVEGGSTTHWGNDSFNYPCGIQTRTNAISDYSFIGTILEKIILPNSVTSIGNGAFSGCGLTFITIPKSVTSIGERVFSYCSGLTSIQVESGNQNYDSRNNCNAIIDSNNQLIVGCKNTIIPNSVTSIGDWAFSGCSALSSITFPNNLTSIGEYAFEGCLGLVYITLPSKLTSIGNSCFSGCKNLTYIYCNAKDVPSAGGNAFYNTGNITFYVPYESTDSYKSTSPWSSFNVQTNYYSQGAEKCSKPTISLSDGRFVFNCETPDAQYRWVISTPEGNTGYWSYVSHPVTLNVFAMKDGYLPSDVATYALSGTPVPASVVGNPVITFSLNIINRSGKAVTLDGDVEFLLGNPDHNGTYLGWDGSYNYTDPIRFSGSPVTLAAGETKTFDGLTWCDEETGSGMGEKSPLDPSLWEASSSNRNVKLYVGGSDEVVVCDNMDPSIIFKEGGIYSIVISSGENTTPVNPTPLVGDVNGDGKVNVADHVKLSEIIMNQK